MPLSKISGDKVFVGEGALSQLDNVLPGYKNILLFSDKDGFQPCGAADYFYSIEKKLKNHTGFQHIAYAGKALPIKDVEEKYRQVKNNPGVDLIAAVGGGTIIDIAKIISIAYSNRCETAEEVLSKKNLENHLDLLFIPTTAGTGSETTSFAVVYRDRLKISIDHKSLLPAYIVLDPLLLKSLPTKVLNSTVLDALAQAIESIWARGSTEESKEYSKEAIRLIMENLDKDNTIERLSGFQVASHLAGKAINISRTTLPHSISYPITSHFGIPHGIAVFLTLPKVVELNYHTTGDTVQDGVQPADIKNNFSILFSLFRVDKIEQLGEKLENVILKLGFSARLRDYGIGRESLPFLADNALTRGRSDNNPRKMNRDDVLDLLVGIY